MRRDLADIRLADRVFAPHYAAHVLRSVTSDTAIRAASRRDSEVLGTLVAGDTFELLELSSELGWGRSVGSGLVGFVSAETLAPIEADAA